MPRVETCAAPLVDQGGQKASDVGRRRSDCQILDVDERDGAIGDDGVLGVHVAVQADGRPGVLWLPQNQLADERIGRVRDIGTNAGDETPRVAQPVRQQTV